MNLSKLNFAQLYKLQSPETLMRVTAAYHKALRREWKIEQTIDPEWGAFSASEAEEFFPWIAQCWKPVINFLRGSELKKATRLAADKWPIRLVDGLTECWIPICTLEARRFPNVQARHALAGLIIRHARTSGLVAYAQINRETGDFRIVADCTAHGPTALLYQSGLEWSYVLNVLGLYNLGPFEVLPWLVLADLRPTTKINPMQWPANTPDVYEHGRSLAYND